MLGILDLVLHAAVDILHYPQLHIRVFEAS